MSNANSDIISNLNHDVNNLTNLPKPKNRSVSQKNNLLSKELSGKQNKSFYDHEPMRKRRMRFLRIDDANRIYTGSNQSDIKGSRDGSKRRSNNFKIKDNGKKLEKKMPYFMETLEVKNNITQLELENRRLQINYAKLRKMNLERLEEIKRSEDMMIMSQDEEQIDQEKAYKKASSMLKIKMKINEMSWEIDKKNREIKRLKLVKRELSEREFLDKIKKSTSDSRKYRNQAFRLMKKYKGYDEFAGMNEQTSNQYQYNNMVLEEYEEMLKEVEFNRERLAQAKFRRQDDIVSKEERLENLSKKNTSLTYQIQDLETQVDKLDDESKERQKYDRDHFMEIEREKQRLDEKLKEINQKKKDMDQEYTQLQANLSEGLENAKKEKLKKLRELESLRNKDDSNKSDDKSEIQSNQSMEEDRTHKTKKTFERMKRVIHFDVEQYGRFLRLRLMYKRGTLKQSFNALVKQNETSEDQYSEARNPSDPEMVSQSRIESNLRHSPLSLVVKEEARLVARYLVEDNDSNYVYFDPETENELVIVKSIWRNFVDLKKHFKVKEVFENHSSLIDIIKNAKYNLEMETKRMGAPETLTEAKFTEFIKATGIDLTEDQHDYMMMHLCGKSNSINLIKYQLLPVIFCQDGIEVYFKKIGHLEDLEKFEEEKMEELRLVAIEEEKAKKRRASKRGTFFKNYTPAYDDSASEKVESKPSSILDIKESQQEIEQSESVKQDSSPEPSVKQSLKKSSKHSSPPPSEKSNDPFEEEKSKSDSGFGGFDDPPKPKQVDMDMNFEESNEFGTEQDSDTHRNQKQEDDPLEMPEEKSNEEFGGFDSKSQKKDSFSGFGSEKSNKEDSFIGYNDKEVNDLEEQVDAGEKNDANKENNKESLVMNEKQFKFNIDGSSDLKSKKIEPDNKEDKKPSYGISVSQVTNFNDEEAKKNIEEQEKQVTSYDPDSEDEKKIKFEVDKKDLEEEKAPSEVRKSREQLLKEMNGPMIMTTEVNNFNDKKAAEELKKQANQVMAVDDVLDEKDKMKKIVKDIPAEDDEKDVEFEEKEQNSDAGSELDAKSFVKSRNEQISMMINVNNTDTFNDPNAKEKVLEESKQVSPVEEVTQAIGKLKFNPLKSKNKDEEEGDSKKPEQPQFSINVNTVDKFNDEKAAQKIREEERQVTEVNEFDDDDDKDLKFVNDEEDDVEPSVEKTEENYDDFEDENGEDGGEEIDPFAMADANFGHDDEFSVEKTEEPVDEEETDPFADADDGFSDQEGEKVPTGEFSDEEEADNGITGERKFEGWGNKEYKIEKSEENSYEDSFEDNEPSFLENDMMEFNKENSKEKSEISMNDQNTNVSSQEPSKEDVDLNNYRPMTFKKSPTPKRSRFKDSSPTGITPDQKLINVEEMKKGDLAIITGQREQEQSEVIVEDDHDSDEF